MVRATQPSIASLFDPALAIVATAGLNGLSFRSLAQSAGVGVSSITNLVGTKTGLIAALAGEAERRDRAIVEPLVDLAERSAPLSPHALTELADLMLETAALAAPALFWSELVQASATQADVAQALVPWFAAQRGWWQRLGATLDSPHAALVGDALFAVSVDERAHGAALQSQAAYRRLRRLCLGRVCRLDFTGTGQGAERALFDHLFAELGAIEDSLGIDRGEIAPGDPRQQRFAMAAAQLLVAEGASELTHRAVAARAEVATSTLAYHFRTREDLVRGAMRAIIVGLKRALFDGEATGDPGNDIARATFALALEASRTPLYLGSAADMRRKRGINLVRLLNVQRVGDPIDLPGAQALSVAGIGARLAFAHCGADVARQATDALIAGLLAAADSVIRTG